MGSQDTQTKDSKAAAKEMASDARQQGQEVASTATSETKTLMEDARGEGQQIAEEAKKQARHVFEDAKSEFGRQAQEQTKKLADSLRRLGDQGQALAQGETQEAGPLPDYLKQTVSQVQKLAGWMESRGFDGIVHETQRMGRRRPAAFLVTAAVGGFLAGRVLRGNKDAKAAQQQSGQQQQQGGQQQQGSGGYSPPQGEPVPAPVPEPAVVAPVERPVREEPLEPRVLHEEARR